MPEVRGRRPRCHGNGVAPSPRVCSSLGPHFKTGLTDWWVPEEGMGPHDGSVVGWVCSAWAADDGREG